MEIIKADSSLNKCEGLLKKLMDLSPLFNQLFSLLFYLIPFAFLAILIKSNWFKGKTGEFVVNVATTMTLDKEKYHLIKNVTLPTADGSTQIDHIIVSVYGIFVVETKNMQGWIFGSTNQPMWTQQIYKHKSKFQNPLRQNYKHVETLKSLLELSEQQIHSLIVFVGDSIFKTAMPDNVTQGGGYLSFIQSKQEHVLTHSEVRNIIEKIEQGRLASSLKTNREHIKHVENLIQEKENKGQSPNCPRCGGKMVIREAKRGDSIGKQFWGCKKFPQCKGSAEII